MQSAVFGLFMALRYRPNMFALKLLGRFGDIRDVNVAFDIAWTTRVNFENFDAWLCRDSAE